MSLTRTLTSHVFYSSQANLAFCAKLVQSLSPLPFMGPKTRLLMNASTTGNLMAKAKKVAKSATSIHTLRDGIPDEIQKGDVCVLVSPSSRQDYQAAQQIASSGVAKAIVIVNCVAKASGEKCLGRRRIGDLVGCILILLSFIVCFQNISGPKEC